MQRLFICFVCLAKSFLGNQTMWSQVAIRNEDIMLFKIIKSLKKHINNKTYVNSEENNKPLLILQWVFWILGRQLTVEYRATTETLPLLLGIGQLKIKGTRRGCLYSL